jgi:putative (di)nucleoside polyphosphate hydrolase
MKQCYGEGGEEGVSMIDEKGYRFNVGIILVNEEGRLFWARRIGQHDAWQFPQGGILENETLEEAMYRELQEELGLYPDDVKILAVSAKWLYYHLPKNYRRYHSKPLCIGQKQKWFLLRFIGEEENIRFDLTESPEFDRWMWVDYWHPIEHVISFKRLVYKSALKEFEYFVFARR